MAYEARREDDFGDFKRFGREQGTPSRDAKVSQGHQKRAKQYSSTPIKNITGFEEVRLATATKLGTAEHFEEFGIQMLLVHCRTAPLGTYPQDLPGQEILTGIQLLIIHQEVGNPRLQDVEFRRSHVLVFMHKTTGEEMRHQIRRARCSKAPASREQFYTPNTAPGGGSNPAQIHSLLCTDTPARGGRRVLQHPSRDEGDIRLHSCTQARSGSGHFFLTLPILFIIPQ